MEYTATHYIHHTVMNTSAVQVELRKGTERGEGWERETVNTGYTVTGPFEDRVPHVP
jgi:hypothetical protein